jgi:hypothetical protein
MVGLREKGNAYKNCSEHLQVIDQIVNLHVDRRVTLEFKKKKGKLFLLLTVSVV